MSNKQLDGEDKPPAGPGGQLKGPHVDVQNMRQLLLGKAFRRYHSNSFNLLRSDCVFLPDCHGYNPDDITVLIDDGNPKHGAVHERECRRLLYCFLVLE